MFPTDKKGQFLAGSRSAIPVVIAYIPMSIAFAISARQTLSVLETIMMSVSVFTGAGQMLAAQMLTQNASLIVIVIATFIINLRYVIMSTCVVNGLKGSPLYLKMIGCFGVTDEAFAIFTTRADSHRSMTYWMGLMLTTYASWITGSIIGAFTSNVLPAVLSDSFGIAMYAMFISILVPGIRGNWKLGVTVLITAGMNWGLSFVLASSWSIVISTLVGAFIGVYITDDVDEEDGFDDTVPTKTEPNCDKIGGNV